MTENKIEKVAFHMVITELLCRATVFSSEIPFEDNYLIQDPQLRTALLAMRNRNQKFIKILDKTYRTNKETKDFAQGQFSELDELSHKVLEATYQIIEDFNKIKENGK